MTVIFAIEKIIDARKSPRRRDSTITTVVLTIEAIVARIFKRVVTLLSPYAAQLRKIFIVSDGETVRFEKDFALAGANIDKRAIFREMVTAE